MINSLLLLHARDSEHVKNDLLQELKGVPTCCVCIDDPKFYQSEALKHSTSKLHIVFFSPGFLTFLECRPEEAYGSFKHLDPQCTFALFCCGLHEREVMCYHTAPLHSYNSWPKFEALNGKSCQTEFSACLLRIIKEAYTTNGFVDNIVIVPELISKDTDFIYVIFTNMLEKSRLSIYIENSSCIQIVPEEVNPYVIKFKVPEMFLENCEAFIVKVQQSNILLSQRTLRKITEDVSVQNTARKDLITKRTSNIVKLDEQLQVLNDIVGMSLESLENHSGEEQKTMIQEDEDSTISLMKMCKKYGLEELSSFLGETSDTGKLTLVPNRDLFGEMFSIHQDCNAKQSNAFAADENLCSISTHVNEIDTYSGIIRSMSLPSVLPPPEECSNASGDYLPMTFNHVRPIFSLLLSSDNLSLSENCVSNSTYVCMRRQSGNLRQDHKGISESQKSLLEVMRAYKAGQMTLWDVEQHFRLWQGQHGGQSNLPSDNETEEICPDAGDFSWVWRRPKRKTSNTSDRMKRISGSSFQSRLSSLETYRKSSSASASSSSSKASEASALTVQSQLHSGSSKSSHDICSGRTSPYLSPAVCHTDSESNLPPLPTRPRPGSGSRMDPDECIKSKDIARRKPSSHLLFDFHEPNSRHQDFDYKGFHDPDALESLFEVCEKYGLEHLGDLFFREFYPDSSIQTKNSELNKNVRTSELKNMTNQSYSQLPSIKWDDEDPVNTKRPLSLPSTLFKIGEKDLEEDDIGKGKEFSSNQIAVPGCPTNKCEEYINSMQSSLYASIQAYMSLNSQKDCLQRDGLSRSQRELLELMNAFKRGEKTISQVEQQFQEWHRRNMETASTREEQLSQLKDQYEKAQKSSYFGIKKFILGKPKKKNSKTSTSSKPGKRNKKSESDMRRLSKVSQTSTSSNVSDSSDVFKTPCYFNPAYGETTQEMTRKKFHSSKHSVCSSPSINPPPLPPRPTLTPAAILKSNNTNDEIIGNLENEKNLLTSNQSLKVAVKEKPNPPPKPAKLLQKVCGSESEFCLENEQDAEKRPDSPVYIIPNKVIQGHSRKHNQLTKMGQSSEAHPSICPVSIAHACAKAAFKPVFSTSCSGTGNFQTQPKQDEATGNKTKQSDDPSLIRQVLLFPSPWLKSKKTEESTFYIARRCSSSPNLSVDMKAQPIYLDLQELFGNRIRSIRRSNSPQS